MKTIIAIDPGPEKSEVVWYSNGVVSQSEHGENVEVLQMIQTSSPEVVIVCEMIASYGMPVGAETFETVFWIGRFAEKAESRDIQFHRVFRKEVKLHLCGNLRAKDGNVRQAIIDKLGAPGTKKNPGPTYGVSGHAWQALALAVTFEETVLKNLEK